MPELDYDTLIVLARSGNQDAQRYLAYLNANRKVDAFKGSNQYNYSPYVNPNDNGLDEVGTVDDSEIDNGSIEDIYKDINNQGSSNGWAANALALMNGATSIFNTGKQMSGIADTSMQRGMIQDIGNIGSQKFGNYGQAFSAFDRINSIQPDLSYDTIRGGSTKERIGGVVNSALTGAITAGQVSGWNPYAMAAGLIGGGAYAGLKWLQGDRETEAEQTDLRLKNDLAQYKATTNTIAGIEDLNNYNHRNKLSSSFSYNYSAKGGPIKRERVKGGVKIRIKR